MIDQERIFKYFYYNNQTNKHKKIWKFKIICYNFAADLVRIGSNKL